MTSAAHAYLDGSDDLQQQRPLSTSSIALLWVHCTLNSNPEEAWLMLAPMHKVLCGAYSRPYQNEDVLRRSCTLFIALVDATAALLGTNSNNTNTGMHLSPHLSALSRMVSDIDPSAAITCK